MKTFREKLFDFIRRNPDFGCLKLENPENYIKEILTSIPDKDINDHITANLADAMPGMENRKVFRKALFELNKQQIELLYILSQRDGDDDIYTTYTMYKYLEKY